MSSREINKDNAARLNFFLSKNLGGFLFIYVLPNSGSFCDKINSNENNGENIKTLTRAGFVLLFS